MLNEPWTLLGKAINTEEQHGDILRWPSVSFEEWLGPVEPGAPEIVLLDMQPLPRSCKVLQRQRLLAKRLVRPGVDEVVALTVLTALTEEARRDLSAGRRFTLPGLGTVRRVRPRLQQ